MPLYAYRCKSCDHRLEIKQAYGEEPITTCSECQGVLVRVISPAAVIIKGGKPSAERRTHRVGKHDIPVSQTEEGHWEQGGIMNRR